MQKLSLKKYNSGVVLATGFMIIIVATSIALVQIDINDWLTWGTFTYPFSFLVTELTNRFYGPKTAKRVVGVGFLFAVALAFSFMNRRIALASSISFLVGQLLDITVFNRFRRKSWWIGPAAASSSASAVDSLVFFPLAFAGGTLPWFKLALGDFAVKFLMDLLLLLPFRLSLWKSQDTEVEILVRAET